MADEAADFWVAFENETGEKVEAKSIGEFFRSKGDSSGIWGLLVLTDKSFRFKHMPSDNWLSSMFKRAEGKQKAQPVEITIPRGDILSLVLPSSGFLARLFGPAFRRFAVTARVDGAEAEYLFAFDPSSGFLAALQKAAPGAEASA